MSLGDLGSLVTAGGSAIQDLFQGEGASAQASSFTGAATLAEQNAKLTAASTRIQETQTARQVYQTIGTQEADVAGAGFTESGSALDLLRSSAQQGSLAKSLVNIEGAISENSYAAQAGAYKGLATAYNEAATGDKISAIGSIGGALLKNVDLASKGQTVVKGIDYVSGLFSSAPEVGTQFSGAAAATEAASTESFLAPGVVQSSLLEPTGLLSTTDAAVSSGADLSAAFAASDVGVDTSEVAIGTSETAASTGIGDAITGIAGDIASGIGDAASAVGGFVADAAAEVAASAAEIAAGIGDVLASIGEALAFVLSVICTAYYKRGMITRSVWHGAQLYGRDVAPRHVYEAYLLWGRPIAFLIDKSAFAAKVFAPIFIPWAHELAVLAGEKTAKSTRWGRTVFRVTYAFSDILGRVMQLRRLYAHT